MLPCARDLGYLSPMNYTFAKHVPVLSTFIMQPVYQSYITLKEMMPMSFLAAVGCHCACAQQKVAVITSC